MPDLSYNGFYNYLNDIYHNYQLLDSLLHKKLESIAEDDIAEIDRLIRDEQAFVLKAKSFEKRLDKFKESLSLPQKNLVNVIEEMPEEEQERFREIQGKISKLFNDISVINNRCQEMLETKLHVINEIIKNSNANAASSNNSNSANNTNNVINTSI